MNSKLILYFEIAFNIMLPLIGVYFLNWSIGDIFLLFFLEIIIRGTVTVIKLFFSLGNNIFKRFGSIVIYIFYYSILVLFMLILTGNFFNGADKQMESKIDQLTGSLLIGSYFLNSLIPFFISGKFKKAIPNEVIKESMRYEGTLFLVLFVVLLSLSVFTKLVNVNHVLATALIIGKNTAAYFIHTNYEKKKNKQ